jgi:putative ABC transport system ATP-binding protein
MLEVTDLSFRYPLDRTASPFELRTSAFTVAEGGTLALIGPSGCGKSTLLSLLSGERVPAAGDVRFGGVSLSRRSESERRAFRVTSVGLIFQEFRLIESLSVLENILLPCRLHPALPLNAAARLRAGELAERLGIGELLRRFPHALSHGERQRVAVARGLLAEPKFILADEPTGNLDPAGKRRLIDELVSLARENNAIVIVATHDHGLLPSFDQVIDLGSIGAGASAEGTR